MILCCEDHIVNQLTEDAFSEQEKGDYLQLVFLGIITTLDLSIAYDFRIKSILERALTEGFGGTLLDFPIGTPEHTLLRSFQINIANFTSAKQYQQVRDMERFLRLSFDDFLTEAGAIFDEYNKAWLQTEFETAVNASRSGKRWIGFEKNKERRPMLTYHTQKDSRVRPEHARLEGITKPVDDPFWNNYAPPNGWNCRCFLTSSATKKETSNSKIPFGILDEEVPDLFRFNPGKSGLLFHRKHPYFDIKRGDSQLRRQNFNLPV